MVLGPQVRFYDKLCSTSSLKITKLVDGKISICLVLNLEFKICRQLKTISRIETNAVVFNISVKALASIKLLFANS